LSRGQFEVVKVTQGIKQKSAHGQVTFWKIMPSVLSCTLAALCCLAPLAFVVIPGQRALRGSQDAGMKAIAAIEPSAAPTGFSSAVFVGSVASVAVLAIAAQRPRNTSRASLMKRGGLVEKDGSGNTRFTVPTPIPQGKDALGMAPTGGAAVAKGPWSPETELGAIPPLGFWDPCGFCDGIDEVEFRRLRSAEIKHGRVCMYATIGYMWPFYAKLPGELSPSLGLRFEDIPVGLKGAMSVPAAGWIQIFLLVALCEFGIGPMQEWKTGPGGDKGKGFLGLFGPITDPAKKERSLTAEISNGRLAMLAFTGMCVQETAFGTDDMWFGPAS